jgi:quercetin dioxygenase-like cupin family protein
MGGSIAHPDPHARRVTLVGFLAALEGALRDAAAKSADPATAASLVEFLGLVGSIDPDSRLPPLTAPPSQLTVCRFWEPSLRASSGAPRALIAALERLGPSLSWTQNPNYRRRPPDATFLDNYGYAVIAGPTDGPPALATAPRLALGVLLLGPHAHYPLHAHPAVEIYYTLTSGGEWWRDEGPWRQEPPGSVIHHAPNVRHATRAGTSALLATYLWRGELATHAKLTPAGETAG